ncbi:uncharacterized protein UDID_19599 [Ustilago sp. UG-2017a]|nr:uncharacterized protein UDID_19599 [Ustilago sp. UG-2017a]
MLTSLPPFLFVIVARSPSKKMRVRRRSSRQQPSWLFVIALSYVLILTFSSAAYSSQKPAEDVDLYSSQKPAEDVDLYPPPKSIINHVSPAEQTRLYRLRQSIARLRLSIVQQGRQWWTSSVSARIARARSKLSPSMGAFLGRYSSEGRRLRKTEPKRGEVEIKPIYKLSPEELEQLNLPQNGEPKDTPEVTMRLNGHMPYHQSEIHHLQPMEDIEEAQRFMDKERAEADLVKAATGGALQQSNPELRAGVSGVPKAFSFSGVPSSRWNADSLASKSANSMREGAQGFVNAPRVHHGEHSGASERKDIVLRYPGEEIVMRGWPVKRYFFTLRTGLDDQGPFMTYSALSEKQKKAVDQVLRKHKSRLVSQGVYFNKLGWKGDDLYIGRFDIPGHGAETLRVSGRRDFLRPLRKIPVVYRSKVSFGSIFGSIFGTPNSRLPSHISSWLKDEYPKVYEDLAKARLRKRAPVSPECSVLRVRSIWE